MTSKKTNSFAIGGGQHNFAIKEVEDYITTFANISLEAYNNTIIDAGERFWKKLNLGRVVLEDGTFAKERWKFWFKQWYQLDYSLLMSLINSKEGKKRLDTFAIEWRELHSSERTIIEILNTFYNRYGAVIKQHKPKT